MAYLPSDDVLYPEHLAGLAAALDAAPDAVLAYSGVRYHYNRHAQGCVPGGWLQLVQVMHRRVDARWSDRPELESDDLDRLYWSRLRMHGASVGTGAVTCEWVDHPRQRHKLMQEPVGGINPFRQRYRVATPLLFHTSTGNAIDESGLYRRFREGPPTPRAADGLRILVVGELAYNAERILALAGLPMIQRDNGDAIVAAQALARGLGIGLFYRDIEDLAARLRDEGSMDGLRERVWAQRETFCFDTHVPGLVAFFREVIVRAGTVAGDARTVG